MCRCDCFVFFLPNFVVYSTVQCVHKYKMTAFCFSVLSRLLLSIYQFLSFIYSVHFTERHHQQCVCTLVLWYSLFVSSSSIDVEAVTLLLLVTVVRRQIRVSMVRYWEMLLVNR